MKKEIIKTAMMNRYFIKFNMRLAIFISVFVVYITKKELILDILLRKFSLQVVDFEITPLHLLWALFMGIMILHLFPHRN